MTDFKVTHYKIRTGNSGNAPDTPFSAVFLSDMHNASYGEGNCRLLQEIRSQNPEVIFVAGDMLTATEEPQMNAALSLMDELTRTYPVYYANGNHEHRMREFPEKYGNSYEKYADSIRSFGVHLLENTSERIRLHRMDMTVWGLELSQEYFGRGSRCELLTMQMERELGKTRDGSFHVLLAHHPGYFRTYADWGANLTLSGHYHGGIIRLPFLGGLISPQLRLFPEFSRGLYGENGRQMIVSSGLGSHTVNVRINNPPEMVVIDFIP